MKYIIYGLMISGMLGASIVSAAPPPRTATAPFAPNLDPEVLALLNPAEAEMYRQGADYQACMASCQEKYDVHTTNLDIILAGNKNIQNCIKTTCRS